MAVTWGQLVLRLASACRALYEALLGPQAHELWSAEHFTGNHVALACSSKPGLCSGVDTRFWEFAQRSQGLGHFLLGQGITSRCVAVWGGGWLLPELQQTLTSLSGLESLRLLDVESPAEADCITDAILHLHVTNITYTGSFGITFPRAAESLHVALNRWAAQQEVPRVFAGLWPLGEMRDLRLDLRHWCMTSEDVQKLVVWHSQLQQLTLCLHVFGRGPQHAVSAIALLPSSVEVSLQLLVKRPGRQHLLALVQQLLGVQLHELSIRCRSAMLCAAAEEYLAHCTISHQLTLELQGAPARRLQRLPAGLAVVYGSILRIR